MAVLSHPGRLLRRELDARGLSANRLALDIGVPSGRVAGILNGRRSITADTAARLGRHFGDGPGFWVGPLSPYAIVRDPAGAGAGVAAHTNAAIAAIAQTSDRRQPDALIRL